MKAYKLLEDEVCLCETEAYNEAFNEYCEVLLTNKNLVLTYNKKHMFKPTEYFSRIYQLSEIKYFNGEPQVKIKRRTVEIYFKTCEVKLNFDSKWFGTENTLYNEFIKLLSGKNMAERGADKFKGAIKLVDDTLGIDTLGAARSAVENTTGVSLTGQTNNVSSGMNYTGQTNKIGGKLGLIDKALDIAKNFIPTKKVEEVKVEEKKNVLSDNIETLKKLKELVDIGVLTQEEFEAKKRDLLGL